MEKIKITLTGSLIGTSPKQRAVAKSLGLSKIGSSSVQNNDESVKGKIKLVAHLIKVENVQSIYIKKQLIKSKIHV